MKNVSIIGATGYVGMEIVRLLSTHPSFNITHVISQSYVGKIYSDVYPTLRGICDLECEDMNIEKMNADTDVFITALPHGVSSEIVPKLIATGKKVLDHSGDYRYSDVSVYEKAYAPLKHTSPDLLVSAIYGLPEIYRDDIKKTNLVANPGCYPTCSILGLMPAIEEDLIDTSRIIVNAASGVSGAGRKADLAFAYCEMDGNYKSYSPVDHRHTSEIEQELSSLAGEKISITFTPHLLPLKRGMLNTIYVPLKKDITEDELYNMYSKRYINEYFVRVLPKGTLPEIKNVAGSNYIDISFRINKDTNTLIIFSCIDNLMKGAAGQAVQTLNLMCGYEETEGLKNPGLYI